MPNKLSCGVDFGTSNSTCAISSEEGVRLVSLEGDNLTLPSALFFCDDGAILFGREAIRSYMEGEDGRLMRGLKTVLGTSLMHEKTIVQNRSESFADILSTYIRHLKDKAEAFCGDTIENAVFGRPVHFHDNNPEADEQSQQTLESIAKSIGFKNIIFQYEPIAAAFAHERDIKTEKLSLVIDLGGGTSDFTVIRLSNHKTAANREKDILGTTGIRIGGTNFDQRLSMQAFMPYLGLHSSYRSDFDHTKILQVPLSPYADLSDWSKVNFAQTRQAIRSTEDLLRNSLEPEKLERLLKVQQQKSGHAFLQEIEHTKIKLTSHAEAHSDFNRLGLGFGVTITAKEFEKIIEECIRKISLSIEECIKLASVSKDEIELVILTGGSSELPVINRLVQEHFPAAAISKENKFSSVGLGLAYNSRTAFS